MSVPGDVESTGNEKWPSLLFHCWGKKNSHADQSSGDEERHAACTLATMDPELNTITVKEKLCMVAYNDGGEATVGKLYLSP